MTLTTASPSFHWDHSYRTLPQALWVDQAPETAPNPRLVYWNRPLAEKLGLDSGPPDAAMLAGSRLPPGAAPLAQAYCGHQFGHFTQLGDGRALLLGEHLLAGGGRVDVQLKGSGQTPFSRRGDGKAALGPMLREVIFGEALQALGIPTTRGLCVVATGAPVYRETPLPGAVLTRIAASHIRVGTFEYAVRSEDRTVLPALQAYTRTRHDPEVPAGDVAAWLRRVCTRQAQLIAQWMSVGFVHGVMNTDNMALSGETIDFGPCAFLDRYSPDAVFSSIDSQGRYAYGNQPPIAQWNLARLAETVLPLFNLKPDAAVALAQEILEQFADDYTEAYTARMRAKLGLQRDQPGDAALVADFLEGLDKGKLDFTQSFARLDPETETLPPHMTAWTQRWRARLQAEALSAPEIRARLHAANPVAIPRHHQVESALKAAEAGDLQPFLAMLDVLRDPLNREFSGHALAVPPPAGTPPAVTFCGT